MQYNIEQLRKIDALVAEHVMGYKCVYTNRATPEKYEWFIGETLCNPMRYTESISAAWEVIDLLRKEDSFYYCIESFEKGTRVDMCGINNADVSVEVSGVYDNNSVSLAICLSALRVKGIDLDVELFLEENQELMDRLADND